jgi:hypothetical protein
MAHRCPLCWHPLPLAKAKGRTVGAPAEALFPPRYPGDIISEWRAKSSRNAERHQIGLVGDIIPDSRATSLGISIRTTANSLNEAEIK